MLSSRTLSRTALGRLATRRALATSTQSGIPVHSADDGRAVSELALIVGKAGSRYEASPGLAHVFRNFTFRDTKTRSALRLTREAELLGGEFSAEHGREDLVLRARFLREDLPYFVDALGAVARSTLFKPHELAEQVLPLTAREASLALHHDSAYVAREAAHQVAFRSGLGNRLFVTKGFSPKVEDLQAHARNVYTKDNIQLYARGVNASDLDKLVAAEFSDLAATGNAAAGAAALPASNPHGGESRQLTARTEQAVVFGFAGAPMPGFELLKTVLHSRSIKWSEGTGVLDQLAAGTGVQVSVQNHQYSDAALFTITLTSIDPSAVAKVAQDSVAALRKLAADGVSAEAGKAALSRAAFNRAEAETNYKLGPLPEEAKEGDIKALAKGLLQGKPVLAAVGNTFKLPYLDDLLA